MLVRRLLLPVLALLLITVQALPAAAQPPQPMPDDMPALAQGPVDPQDDASPFGRPDHRVAPAPEAAASPEVAIGQPGLSFRYVQTLGETGVPYPVDTQHLNRPNGLATNSSGAVFVVEEKGLRLLKYDQAGSPLFTVGTPGQPYHDGPYLAYPKDVALDNAGNLVGGDRPRGQAIQPHRHAAADLPRSQPLGGRQRQRSLPQPQRRCDRQHGTAVRLRFGQ